MSKSYLAGETGAEALRLAPPSWYPEHEVEFIEDSAVKLAADRGSVVLAGGTELSSDAVVLATGGRARQLSVPGHDSPGVVALRTLADAERLRAALRPGLRLLIVGAGLIGAETAATAVAAGAEVTLVDPVPVPLIPAVGQELAEVLHAMHPAHGVDVRTGVPVEIARDGQRLLVDLDQHPGLERISADLVLVAIGLEADTSVADSAGLRTCSGIEVDEAGRTSHPAIRAAGDGIRLRQPDGTPGRRAEHWEAALLSGTAVACGLLGEELPPRPPSWFWSDRYGVHAEAVGSMSVPGRTVVRTDGAKRFAFRIGDGQVLVGCAAIDGGKTLRAAKRLIAARAVVDPGQLADPAVDLKKLGRAIS